MHFRTNEDGTLISIGDTIRVSEALARKEAVATEELLSDARTKEHYHAPIERPKKNHATGEVLRNSKGKEVTETVYAKDALGNDIRLGEPMTYLDYLGPRVWRVYRLESVHEEPLKDGTPVTVDRWMPQGPDHPSKDAAITAALTLATGL